MSSDSGRGGSEEHANITAAVVDFLEDSGVTTYAVTRSPSSILLSLPNEPEIAVQRHVQGLKGRLQEIVLERVPQDRADLVLRDPRDHHAIIIEITSPRPERDARSEIVRALAAEEPELRRRGIESLLLFGSAATEQQHPNDVDLLARFQADLRLTAFDIADVQAYLEHRLGRRVDLSSEKTFPSSFRQAVEQSGIRIFGS
jgi:predicted nucleotidyltransferase